MSSSCHEKGEVVWKCMYSSKLHLFNPTVGGGEWSALLSDRITTKKIVPCTHWIRGVDPRVGLGSVQKIILLLTGIEPVPSRSSLYRFRYLDSLSCRLKNFMSYIK
jgi:hypothetical protein